MRKLVTLALLLAGIATAAARDAVPDLTGMWTGTFRSLVYGSNAYHPGSQKVTDPPRVTEINVTVDVEGQDGRLLWGHAWVGDGPKDPFAWAIGADNKTIIGSDSDGLHFMKIVSRGKMDRCYVQPGNGPSGSIVATCGTLERVKK